MSAEAAVLAGRVAAEAIMVDAVVVERPGASVLNETTGQMETPFTVVYTGKCRVQKPITLGSTPNAGEHQFTVLDLIVQLPVDSTAYRIGDRVRVTASVLDPALVGVVATVTALMHKTHATARRLLCEEVTA